MIEPDVPAERPAVSHARQALWILPTFSFWLEPDDWQSIRGPVALVSSGAAVYLIPLLGLGRWPSVLLSGATCLLVIGSIERFVRWRDHVRRRRVLPETR